MKKLYLSIAFLLTFTFQVPAQLQGLDVVKVPEAQQPYSGEYIYIPDVDGYKALKCDFHVHTIFFRRGFETGKPRMGRGDSWVGCHSYHGSY